MLASHGLHAAAVGVEQALPRRAARARHRRPPRRVARLGRVRRRPRLPDRPGARRRRDRSRCAGWSRRSSKPSRRGRGASALSVAYLVKGERPGPARPGRSTSSSPSCSTATTARSRSRTTPFPGRPRAGDGERRRPGGAEAREAVVGRGAERGVEPAVHDRPPRRRGPRGGQRSPRPTPTRSVAYLDDPLETTVLVLVRGGGTIPDALTKKLKEVGGRRARARQREDRRRPRQRAARTRTSRCAPTRPSVVAAHLGDDAGRVAALVEVLASALRRRRDARRRRRRAVPRRSRRGARRTSSRTRSRRATSPARSRCCTGCSRAPSARQPEPMHPLQVLGMLLGYYRRLLRLDDPGAVEPADAVAALGGRVKEYPARKALERGARARHRRHPPGVRRARTRPTSTSRARAASPRTR